MQYSLLSRFQGAMAGVSLGSRLIRSGEKSQFLSVDSPRKANLNSQTWLNLKPYRLQGDESHGEAKELGLTNQEGLVIQMARSLIRCQGLEPADWHKTWQQWQQQIQQTYQFRDARVEKDSFEAHSNPKSFTKDSLSPGEIALATLPIALLFHEQPAQLDQQLQELIKIWQLSSSLDLQQAVFAFNLAIALALKEELKPTTLISQILNHLDPQTNFSQQLQEVQTLLEQRVSLEAAREQLFKSAREKAMSLKTDHKLVALEDTTSVALAFYSFITTPYDAEIALLRTLQIGWANPFVTILTGALSGTHNSLSGFPLSWQLQLKRTTTSSSQVMPELFAVWSGVYNTTNPFFEIHSTPAVTAANLIRSYQS